MIFKELDIAFVSLDIYLAGDSIILKKKANLGMRK